MDHDSLPPVNACAPDLPRELSPEAMAEVERIASSGTLSPFATPDSAALRRQDSPRDRATALRPAFVRDTEKIIHMPAYNRLAGKTQVFSFPADDDLARRGLHVQLVGRVAHSIARALGLNTDLVEAIALGHDMGHTPFGHAGERFLNEVYHRRTGRWFMHNVHSVRVLDNLYGRNLTLQTLDGVLAHNGECAQRTFPTSDLDSFAEFDAQVERCVAEGPPTMDHLRPATLEGCVVRLSDMIAYLGKDRQDAIRAGLVAPEVFADGLGGAYNTWALDAFICDVVEHSLGSDELTMSQEGYEELRRAKKENYQKIYLTGEVNGKVTEAVRDLFALVYTTALEDLQAGREEAPIFRHHVEPLTQELRHYGRTYPWQDDLDQTVVDYIASMTDDYFVAAAQRLDPDAVVLPERDYFDPKGSF